MPLITHCPRCDQAVTIPDGLDAGTAVRCPLCEAEYPLDDALTTLPPALVPVADIFSKGLDPHSEAALKSDLISEPFHVPGEETPRVPADSAPENESLLDAWNKKGTAPKLEVDVGDHQPFAAGELIAAEEGSTENNFEGATHRGAGKSRQRKSKSAARHAIEAIVGGFFGLLIGYYLICWFGGPRFDLPELPLPFLPHTINKSSETERSLVEHPREFKPPASPDKSIPLTPNDRQRLTPEVPEAIDSEPSADDISVSDPTIPTLGAQPLPANYVGPRDGPTFTSDELGKVLKAAYESISDANAKKPFDLETYKKFQRLAEVLPFVIEGPQLDDRREAAGILLERLAQDPATVDEINQYALKVLDGKFKSQEGLLFAGTSGRQAQKNRLHGTVVRLVDHPVPVIVMSDRPLPFGQQEEVLLLGSLITEPNKNLAGYSGTAPWVVWLGEAVRRH